jgi:hypothetical protein
MRYIGHTFETMINKINKFQEIIINNYNMQDIIAENQTPFNLATLMYDAYEGLQDDYENSDAFDVDDPEEIVSVVEEISRELGKLFDNVATTIVERVLQDGLIYGYNQMLNTTRDIFHIDIDELGNVVRLDSSED